MPEPTPFHPRTSALCRSLFWKEWAGYHAVRSFDTVIDPEYFAFRHAAGLIDVSPLFKYDVSGKDAADFLSYVMVRDIRKLQVGRVAYSCWCDDDGKAIDDGTITRLGDDLYRVTSAEPSFRWFDQQAEGFDVVISDRSRDIAALSLQGPRSREILKGAVGSGVEGLRFFRVMEGKIGKTPVHITRTGYTGDLGYEIWVEPKGALAVWDAIMEAGKIHGIRAAGLDAMDITRIEAGFILLGVDYKSSPHCDIEEQKSSAYEIGLGRLVNLDRPSFIGQRALREEKERGSEWAMVGLDISWEELEALYDAYGLPPHLPAQAWRENIPLYKEGRQIGRATSGTWSPTLKQNLALATVEAEFGALGTHLEIEVTVEWERRVVPATVVQTPFFNPQRKRS